MSRKALFFDIDGTLLSETTKEIPASAEDALRRARKAGHLVFINSGRARCLMREVEQLALADGYLCGCGTYIEVRGETLLHHTIRENRRLQLQNSILDYRVDGVLEGKNGCAAQAGISHMPQVEHIKEIVRRSGVLAEINFRTETAEFDKFCVRADEDSDIRGFLKSLAPDITAIDRGFGLYECVPSGFNKATCMEFILKHFGIPWEQSYAFGDSMNDLAMMKYACNSVIMGKHDKALEQYASFITRDVDDGGIAHALEKLEII